MVDDMIVQELVSAIKPEQTDKNRTYAAIVSKIDKDGTVWVYVNGSDKETPTASTSSEVKAGDSVDVEWRNNKLYIAGNPSNPAAGSQRVNVIEQTANQAGADARRASTLSSEAKNVAQAAAKVAGDTEQHFWFTETGNDTGAHITEKTQEEFLADPDNGGGNLLARSNGIALRNGLDEVGAFYTESNGGDVYATLGFENDKLGKVACFYDDNADETVLVLESKQKNGSVTGQVLVAAYQTGYLINIGSILYVRGSGYANRIEALEDVRIDKDLYVDNDLYINNTKVADHVIERGTSGHWKYIKWASGRVEAEGYVTFSSLTFAQRGSMYRSGPTSFTIPSGIFDTAPSEGHAWIQSGSASDYFGAVIGSLTTTGGNCMVWKATSGTGSNVSVHMRLVYRG